MLTRGVACGDVAEDHGVGDAGAGSEVVAAHDGGGAVAGGVEALDRPVVLVDHLRVFVGDEPAAGADITWHHLDRVVRGFVDRAEAGVHARGSDRPAPGCRPTRPARSRGRCPLLRSR